jgi:cobalt-zinc-cadmium efflux system outer membrane protein
VGPIWRSIASSALALWLAPAVASAVPLTLDAALVRTLEHHPRLRALEAERGRLAGASARAGLWLPDNPELTGDWTRRDGPDDTTTDWEVGLAQRFEVGGQRGQRVARARARMSALDGSIAALRVDLAADLRGAWVDLTLAEAREEVAADVVGLNDRLVTLARTRFAAGDVSEVDVALAELARSEALRQRLEETRKRSAARQAVARALGVERLPAMDLAPLRPPPRPPALTDLRQEVDGHPRLIAVAAAREAARADLALARAGRLPDVTIAAHVGEEDSSDTLAGVTVSLPLPIVHRRQQEIGAARADATRLAADAEATRSDLWQAAERAHASLTAALEELDLFAAAILPGLDTHLRRLLRAYQLGEIDLTALTVAQARVVAARFDHLDALRTAWQARIDLDRALGVDALATNAGDAAEPMRNHR